MKNLKKQTNFSSKMLKTFSLTVAMGTAMVAIIYLKLSKNYRIGIHTTKIVSIFIPSCHWHNLASFYLINEPVINSEYSIQ